MALYKCNNKECNLYGKEITGNTHIVYNKYETTDKGAPCPECGQIREMVYHGMTTHMYGSPNICNK